MLTCRILIVDDDSDDIDLLLSSFHEIGVKEVHGVHSMPEAIKFLQFLGDLNALPKIIITDLNMPGQNGFELLKFLKNTTLYKQIPVIVFSTSISCKEIETSLALGALDYIPKPVLLEDYIDFASKINTRISEYK